MFISAKYGRAIQLARKLNISITLGGKNWLYDQLERSGYSWDYINIRWINKDGSEIESPEIDSVGAVAPVDTENKQRGVDIDSLLFFAKDGRLRRKSTELLLSMGCAYCPKCKMVKDLHDFSHGRNGKRAKYCVECRTLQSRENHRKHYPAKRESILERRKEIRDQLISQKGGKCINCGYADDACAIDFHHLHSKDAEIGVLITHFAIAENNQNILPKLTAEIEKCVLLCANCHRRVHNGTLNLSHLL